MNCVKINENDYNNNNTNLHLYLINKILEITFIDKNNFNNLINRVKNLNLNLNTKFWSFFKNNENLNNCKK